MFCTNYIPGLTYRDPGEWWGEGDLYIWESEHGYYCCIKRNSIGVLCGYVGWEQELAMSEENFECHGGITYGIEKVTISPLPSSISVNDYGFFADFTHKKFLGKTLFVMGFDCAHYLDVLPTMSFTNKDRTYRNFNYVYQMVNTLAEQVAGFDPLSNALKVINEEIKGI